jgi:hypothetical protein
MSNAVSRFFAAVGTETHENRPVLVKSALMPMRQIS